MFFSHIKTVVMCVGKMYPLAVFGIQRPLVVFNISVKNNMKKIYVGIFHIFAIFEGDLHI